MKEDKDSKALIMFFFLLCKVQYLLKWMCAYFFS